MTETETQILDMLQVGRSRDVIIAKVRPSGWSTFDVQQFAEQRGYVFDTDGCPRSKAKLKATTPRVELDPDAIAPKAAFVPSETPAAPVSPPSPAQQDDRVNLIVTNEVAQHVTVLVRGLSSTSKVVQVRAARAVTAIARLADALEEHGKQEQEIAAKKAAQEAAREKIRRLQQQLADAKAALKTGTTAQAPRRRYADPRSAAQKAGVDPVAVRTWAHANNVHCSRAGQVPKRVVDAYLAANPSQVAS